MKIPRIKQTQSLGIALGGGGAAGYGHIGVLSVLEEAGVKIDYIAGTSMGGIMGGLFALGYTTKELTEFVHETAKLKLTQLRNFNLMNESLVNPEKLVDLLDQAIGNKRFEDCKIPFCAIAIDIESGKEVILDKGPMKYALIASAAVPLIFPPVALGDRILVDGGLLNNVPLNVVNRQKLDVNMGIAIKNYTSRQHLSAELFKHYFAQDYDVIKQASFFKEIKQNVVLLAEIVLRSFEIATSDSAEIRIAKANPDIVIRPDIEVPLLALDKADEAIKAGREAMEKDFAKLEQLLTR